MRRILLTAFMVAAAVAACGDDGGGDATSPNSSAEPKSADDVGSGSTTTSEPRPTTPTTAPIPQAVLHDGVGSGVVEISRPDGPGAASIVYATHDGGEFGLKAGSETLVLGHSGPYSGSTLLLRTDSDLLEIQAGGAWHVEFRSLRAARPIAPGERADGIGDEVFVYREGGRATATLEHTGQSNFTVNAYTESGDIDQLANVIGPYQSVGVIDETPAIVSVRARLNGAWAITIVEA